jgi:hypothetical protein
MQELQRLPKVAVDTEAQHDVALQALDQFPVTSLSDRPQLCDGQKRFRHQ